MSTSEKPPDVPYWSGFTTEQKVQEYARLEIFLDSKGEGALDRLFHFLSEKEADFMQFMSGEIWRQQQEFEAALEAAGIEDAWCKQADGLFENFCTLESAINAAVKKLKSSDACKTLDEMPLTQDECQKIPPLPSSQGPTTSGAHCTPSTPRPIGKSST